MGFSSGRLVRFVADTTPRRRMRSFAVVLRGALVTDSGVAEQRRVSHRGRWIALSVGMVVLVLAVVLAMTVGRDPLANTRTSRLLGKAAPTFDLPTLAGGRARSADLAGKAVI